MTHKKLNPWPSREQWAIARRTPYADSVPDGMAWDDYARDCATRPVDDAAWASELQRRAVVERHLVSRGYAAASESPRGTA